MRRIFIASVYLVLGCLAHADQVNCIKWKDVSGATVGTYCKPFSVRAGSGIQFSDNGIGMMTITSTGAVAGAGGSNTQVNFNSSGTLAGSSGMTWNNSTSTLTATHIAGLDNRPYIDVKRDCGLVGDGVTDDSTALATCMATYITARLYFPPTNYTNSCSYYFASSITPPVGSPAMVLSGASGSFLNSTSKLGGTVLCFPAGVTGINLQNCGCTIEYISLLGSEGTNQLQAPTLLNFPSGANLPQWTRSIASIQRATNILTVTVTRVVGIEGVTQQEGSTVKITGVVGDATMNGLCVVTTLTGNTAFGGNPNGFTCYQNGADSGPFVSDGQTMLPTTGASTADGIRVCNNFTYINHVTIQSFGRHGINADSNPGNGCTAAFSDDLIVRDSFLNGNQADGYYCSGTDCNAHLLSGNAVYYNVLWGLEDQSSLGNTHIGNQVSNNSHFWATSATPATKNASTVSRASSTVTVVMSQALTLAKLGSCIVVAGVSDTSFNTATPPAGTATQGFFINSFTDTSHFTYIQPGAPADASSSGGTIRFCKFQSEAYVAAGVDDGAQKIQTQSAVAQPTIVNQYVEGGQYCKFGSNTILLGGANTPGCVQGGGGDWVGNFISTQGCFGLGGTFCIGNPAFVNLKDANGESYIRAGVTTDYPYGLTWLNHSSLRSWGMIASPAGTLGKSGYFAIDSQGYAQTRLVLFGKDNSGNSYLNGEGTGGVYFNRNSTGTGAGTGGTHFYSGGSGSAEIASIDNAGIITGSQVIASGSSVLDGVDASAPSAPAAGHRNLYPKTSVGWCGKDSSNVETCYSNAPTEMHGFCSGTSTSSTTLSIGGAFGGTSQACSGTSITRAMRVGSAGTLKNLYVVSDAGFNASSGVFTVYVCTVANQVACGSLTTSSITCTVGTGQACSDTTHSQAIAAGDAVIVKYTTQATETLGNIMVTLEKYVN